MQINEIIKRPSGLNRKRQPVMTMTTSFEQFALENNFIVFDKELFQNLELYMKNKPNKFNNNKGLLFVGGVGSGKTALMKLLSEYGTKVGLVLNILHFEAKSVINLFNYYTEGVSICLDDIGSEPDFTLEFGNKFNIVERVVYRYYENAFQEGYYFCGTTNLTKNQLKERYSERVIDRLREMVNIVPFTNQSFRK
jgi:DNA replication protein DnaC